MKRLSMLFALLAFLAMPAAAHDPPANEGKKQIHGIMAIAPSCEGDGCYATYFRVFITSMQGCSLSAARTESGEVISFNFCDASRPNPKKTPDDYLIQWKMQGQRWRSKDKFNQLNRGSKYIPHESNGFTVASDPHSGFMSPKIDEFIRVDDTVRMKVRVRAIYYGERNGPWITTDMLRGWLAD